MVLVNELPKGLFLKAMDKWQAYCEAAGAAGLFVSTDSTFIETAVRVFAFSDFVVRCLIRRPELLEDLVQSGDLYDNHRAGHYLPYLQEARRASVTDETTLGKMLCRVRSREMVRIAWRDLAGLADLDETMTDLSAFADACLEVALSHLYDEQCDNYGTPIDSSGVPQRLVVIGMGKLGARELNFSSDIDLIFAYPESGQTAGPSSPIRNEEFFVRLCRRYVKLMSTVTTDGLLFRVDIRLRPFGDSGPLVMSFDNMEDYYQHQGRDWERYAWIKARVVAGDSVGERLLERLKPFIYRRYLDYGAFESLRDMKQKIVLELKRKGMTENVKLGPGGIREIEFFGQTFQLLRGGVMPSLQCGPIQETLTRLARENHISLDSCNRLRQAYRFLRNTEHRLQEFSDQQTHQLPQNPDEKERLAGAMGFATSSQFFQQLECYRQTVHEHFHQILELEKAEDLSDTETSTKERGIQLAAIWLSPGAESQEIEVLSNAGYTDPVTVLRLLEAFRQDPATRALSPVGRKRLDNIIPGLLARIGKAQQPMVVLGRLLDLIKTIQRRTVYLALLQENPDALTRLVEFADASSWAVSYLMRHPVLLDELLDARTLFVPPKRPVLQEEIIRRYEKIDPADLEYQMEALRVFKQVNTLRVAAADITGALPLMKVSDHLSDIAEVAVEKAVTLTWEYLAEKHGTPVCSLGDTPLNTGFAVIAYGKLGGLELGYDSDIDLVFLHACAVAQTTGGPRPIDTPQFFARLGQRLIHFLTAHTPAGVLYETDMRLRPSGASGILVSHIDAWGEYQMEKAWTWEHQALVRARGVFGDPALLARFEQIRRRVLSRPRESRALKKEVSDMRERMCREQGRRKVSEFHLKQDPGGMVDIEFIVQYIILLTAHRYPQILEWTDNVRQIQALAEAKIIGDDMAHQLRAAYLTYRSISHRLSLQEKPPIVLAGRMKEFRRTIIRFWNRVLR